MAARVVYSNFLRTYQLGVDERQELLLSEMRAVPPDGIKIEHCGRAFTAFRNVLPPYPDSIPLIKSLRISPGEHVLDVGTGTGVLAVFSAYAGAEKVVAIDINPDAVRNAQHNAYEHGFAGVIDVRLSDVYQNIAEAETFDLIVANLPFRHKTAPDLVSASLWDSDFHAHRQLISGARKHLKRCGRVLLAQASFGDIELMKELAHEEGLVVTQLMETTMNTGNNQTYFVFELTPVGAVSTGQ